MVHDRSEDEAHRLVDTFAELMKHELDENFFKGDRGAPGWNRDLDSKEDALQEVQYHLEKLEASMLFEDEDQIRENGADVGNCVMILLDIMKLIEPASEKWPEIKPQPDSRANNYITREYDHSWS